MLKTVSVVGLGYLGVTQALVLSKLGYKVLGVDTDSEKVSRLNEGVLGFYEPGLQELLNESLLNDSFSLSVGFDETLSQASVHLLCVGTPSRAGSGEFDLSALNSACTDLAKFISPESLVVGRSTVPIGTSDALKLAMGSIAGFDVAVAWNPEFLSEGSALENSFRPDRIVIGVDDAESEEVLRRLYAPITATGSPMLVMDRRTSELVKIAANSFLATKISFINGVAAFAEKSGASAHLIGEALGLDPRIGSAFLKNGVGFGGGCLPKDVAGFQSQAESIGLDEFAALLNSVILVNKRRVQDTVSLAIKMLGPLKGKPITVLGAAFKPGTDDVRESPAIALATQLAKSGAIVTIHDPVVKNPKLGVGERFTNDLAMAVTGSDLLIIATEWEHYSKLEPKSLGNLVTTKNIIDGRGLLEVDDWVSNGWDLARLGEAQT
jgi:UDPglucose 6-dehydrogenase